MSLVSIVILIDRYLYNSMQKTLLLSEGDQNKVKYLITNFAKSEPNLLKYSQCVALMLDRCVFNTKFTLVDFDPLFDAALQVKATKSNEKTEIQGERVINLEQLVFLFAETAKILFKPDPNYIQRFYLTFLSEKIDSDAGEINRARVMVVDDLSKKLITEDAIKQLCLYSEQIRHLFIAYSTENYWSLKRKRRLLLTFREMLLQNKRWSYISLILFLKESETTPHLATVEHVEEVFRQIIPNVGSKQHHHDFYNRHVLSEAYHKDADGQDGNLHPGDPGIMLFQLQLLLLRLAWDTYPKDLEKKDISMVIERYLKYLYLRKNDELNTVQLPAINRKMINKMKEYYRIINNEIPQETTTAKEEHDTSSLYDKLARKMEKEVINAPTVGIDFQQAFKVLDRELTKLPPLPKVEPEYTGKYDKNFAITIGQQPPPQPAEKDDKPKAEKKDTGKKDEIPPREFKWAQVPQTKLSTEDYFKKIEEKLNYEVQPLSDINRGTIAKDAYPVLIGEVLHPPQLPKAVLPFVQAANNALADRNFLLALDNLAAGAAAWKKTTVEFDSVAQLFFEYSRGNISLAAGKPEHAFQVFYGCRKFADTSRLPFTNPDRSLPYYGLGEVFYEMEEYQLAARSFLKSRQIRESVLGLEHVQTASVFNNLAACFFMLGRSQEALGYIEIAEVVLDTELGPHHERTMTARNNLKKVTRGTFENQPQFRKFWEVFEQDKFQKKKKKKKDDGGKKGKK